MAIKLSDVIDGLEQVGDETMVFYRVASGTIEAYNPEWQIDDDQSFDPDAEAVIALPSQYDLNDYQIMVDFTERRSDSKQIYLLAQRLHGHKPFRRFKDGVLELGIQTEWYAFQADAYRRIAIEWCQDNGLAYEE